MQRLYEERSTKIVRELPFFSPVGLNLGNCRYAHLSSCPPSAESGIRAKSTILHHTHRGHSHFDEE